MEKEILDAIVQSIPLVAAKHSHPVEEAVAFGQRYIVGRQGLYREVNTPWLQSRSLIAAVKGATPYGDVDEVAVLKCGSPPASLWTTFIEHARKESPIECAGLMIWNQQTHQWRLAIRDVVFATLSRVDYLEPILNEDEVAVLDVHSHGHYDAFFSKRDDADDLGGIKISAVIGGLDRPTTQVVIRLVCIDSIREVTMDRAELNVVVGAA